MDEQKALIEQIVTESGGKKKSAAQRLSRLLGRRITTQVMLNWLERGVPKDTFRLLELLLQVERGEVRISDIGLRRAWDKARKAIGLPHLRPHDLRVTFARQLSEKGVSLKTIQGLLGHSTPTMALRYIPSDLRDRQAAVKLLEKDEMEG
tara:strand:+ start:5649 stop:6098 length:450 start_codon:yes stop_codon:yes gene_type:complete